MYLVETLGERVYNALASKTENEEMASIYQRLSLNEINTAQRIVNEMSVLEIVVPVRRASILKSSASAVFSSLSHDALLKLLRMSLSRGMFRQWFNTYHENNETFWQAMLDHESLQLKLLKL
jgi:hypothetical protein